VCVSQAEIFRLRAFAFQSEVVTMADQSQIEAAARRLSLAIDALDAALDRRLEADRSGSTFATQLHALGADRARLAAELDTATALNRRLEAANREVSRRLDTAMRTIREMLNGQDSE
jgi:hypothetical protein